MSRHLTEVGEAGHILKFGTRVRMTAIGGGSMPVLVIAVVFFIIFLIMGVMLSSAMLAEHHTNNVLAREGKEHPAK